MMHRGFFITGTDTGIGKTHVTVRLMRLLQAQGLRVVGMKPVASGAEWRAGGWVNEDALALLRAASVPLPYDWVNPCVFEDPVSPHLAAAAAGCRVEPGVIEAALGRLSGLADCVLVEGVGGWLVPLNEVTDVAGLACRLDLPVIQVVGLRLGCINHARLTQAALLASGARIAGWIANHLEPELPHGAGVLATLTDCLASSPLGELPFVGQSGHTTSTENAHWKIGEILRLLVP